MEPLPPRQEIFCQQLLTNGFNQTAAAMTAYGVENASASVQGSRLMDNPKINKRLNELCRKAGLTLDDCLDTLGEGLKAKRAVVVGSKNRQSIEYVDDWQTKTRCAELGLKVHKAVTDSELTHVTQNILAPDSWGKFMDDYFSKKSAINTQISKEP